MANMKAFYYPGEVVEKSEIKDLDAYGKTVINLTVKRTVEKVKGFAEEIEKRIVMFSRKASEADAGIKLGDHVVFSPCKRNPRAFTTLKGNDVETVDILAEGFKVIATKAQFEKVNDALLKMDAVPSPDELVYTDEDAANAAKKSGGLVDSGTDAEVSKLMA